MTASQRLGPFVTKTATILGSIAAVVFLGWLVESCLAAKATCAAFVAAVREDRFVDARALVSPELAPSLEGSPDTEPAHVLRRIQASKDADLGTVQSGFHNEGFVPFACFDGGDGVTHFWIVASQVGGAWRVVELRAVMPTICEASH
jgi:hypothetical protein